MAPAIPVEQAIHVGHERCSAAADLSSRGWLLGATERKRSKTSDDVFAPIGLEAEPHVANTSTSGHEACT